MTTILQNAPDYIHGLDAPDSLSYTTGRMGVHPSVLDFSKINDPATGNPIGQWPKTGATRYRYYCGFTTNQPENCWLYASNDNVNWVAIIEWNIGFLNDPYDSSTMWQNAEDAELDYDPANDRIQLYNMTSTGYADGIMQGIGITKYFWSNTGVLTGPYYPPALAIANCEIKTNSPSVVRESNTVLHMWGVDQIVDKGSLGIAYPLPWKMYYSKSTDNGDTWSAPVPCIMNGSWPDGWLNAYPNARFNHVAAQPNPYIPGQVDFVIQCSVAPNYDIIVNAILIHAIANLSSPTSLSTPLAPGVLLAVNPSGWDVLGIYRSNFTLDKVGSDIIMNLWYSGVISADGPRLTGSQSYITANYDNRCQIGYTSGKVYSLDANGAIIPPADTTAPTITAFSMPSTAASLTVAVTTLTATDAVGVTGYLITESATAPLATDAGWSGTAPTSHTFTSAGAKTAYAWAKDAAGNVSAAATATVTIATHPWKLATGATDTAPRKTATGATDTAKIKSNQGGTWQ